MVSVLVVVGVAGFRLYGTSLYQEFSLSPPEPLSGGDETREEIRVQKRVSSPPPPPPMEETAVGAWSPPEGETIIDSSSLPEEEIILRGIPFAFNDQTIRPEYLPMLNETARILNDNPTLSVLIEGYADAVGSEAFNLRLSRAQGGSGPRLSGSEWDCRRPSPSRGARRNRAPRSQMARDDGSDNPEGRAVKSPRRTLG